MRTPTIRNAIAVYLLAMCAVNFYVVWELRTSVMQGYGDFAAFYTAGRLVQEGRSAELYDAQAQWELQQEFAASVATRKGPLPYVRPPFEALLFAPLASFRYSVAFLIWSLVKLGLLLTVCYMLVGKLEQRLWEPALEAVLVLGFFPIALDFLQGQDGILLLFILAVVLVLWRRGSDMFAGCILALGLFKFHLVIPLALIFLLRRQYKLLVGFAAVALAEVALSIAMVGWTGFWNYPKYLLETANNPGTGMVDLRVMPNLRALIAMSVGWNMPLWIAVIIAAAGAWGVAWLWSVEGRDPEGEAISFSLAIITAIVTSYYAYGQDMTLILLPILLLQRSVLNQAELSGLPRRLYLFAIGILMLAPLYWWLLFQSRALYLGLSLPLIATLVGLAWMGKSRRRTLSARVA